MTRFLRSRRVLLGGGDTPITIGPADVAIDGAMITGVHEVDEARGVEDHGDRLITPAFINAHTHLAMGSLRGLASPELLQGNVVEELYFRVESHLQPGDVRAFTRLGAWESLLCGVGCVWDHYYFGREIADALVDVGLCGVIAPTIQDINGPGVPYFELQWGAMEDLTADSALAAAGIVTAVGPHATDTVSSELWARVARFAADHAVPVHAHIAQSIEEYERSVAIHGCSPIARLQREGVLEAVPSFLLVHSLFASRADVALLDPARHLLVHCPWSQVQFGFPARVGWWRESGLAMALGTDCGACNDTMDVQQELRMAAWGPAYATTWSDEAEAFGEVGDLTTARALARVRSAKSAAQVPDAAYQRLLDAVWAVPGGAHPALPMGRIAAGTRANLLIWDTDHPILWPGTHLLHALTQTTAAPAIHALLVNGLPVAKPGAHQSSLRAHPDLPEWRDEANRRLDALLRRAGVRA